MNIESSLHNYIYTGIVPRYADFDAAHKEDHALTVISQAMMLMEGRDAWLAKMFCPEARGSEIKKGQDISKDSQDIISEEWNAEIRADILITAAACHDLGLVNGRERHHLDSGKIIRNDERLQEWFNQEEIEIIAQAAEDHRASGKSDPRSIYGKIVAEADRVIEQNDIIRRTLLFGQKHYPELSKEEHIERAVSHLKEKYGRGGYLKLWIPWSSNAARLAELQDFIADEPELRGIVEELYMNIKTE
jgi:uncharacterized protein